MSQNALELMYLATNVPFFGQKFFKTGFNFGQKFFKTSLMTESKENR
jgi:hypothetical protein